MSQNEQWTSKLGFILFTAIIGLPLLLAEFVLGRHTQKEAIRAYDTVAPGSLLKNLSTVQRM